MNKKQRKHNGRDLEKAEAVDLGEGCEIKLKLQPKDCVQSAQSLELLLLAIVVTTLFQRQKKASQLSQTFNGFANITMTSRLKKNRSEA